MNGGLIRRSGLIVAALSLLLLFGAGSMASRQNAEAADSETSALIGLINNYRTTHGVSALATSGSANADAQAAAQRAVDACGYTYGLSGHNSMLVSYGYETADNTPNGPGIFPAWESDSYYNGQFSNPYYGSVGIGRAKSASCTEWGYLWIAYFDIGGGGTTTTPTHTPTPTPSPTPTHTPTPTPTSTPAHTPTPTPTPATTTPTPTSTARGSDTPTASGTAPQSPIDATPTPTPTSTPSVGPTATTRAVMPGDVDCGGSVNMGDVLLLLKIIAHIPTVATCLAPAGVDCTGGIDAADALILIEFIEGIPYHLPDGCPSLGSPTPSPTPQETPTPTPTATLEPTKTPTPVLTGINHCELAMIAYHLDTNESLAGFEHCTPVAGTAYDCDFNKDNHKAACLSSSSDFPNYSCSFTGAGFVDCVPGSGEPEYQCFDNGAHLVECLPTHIGYAWYDCTVGGNDVTCTSVAPTPNFACRHEAAEFSCLALAPATPTASPG